MVPLVYGRDFGKVSAAPASPALTVLAGKTIEVSGRPDALRHEVRAFFEAHGEAWEIGVQPCTDLGAMPVEGASAAWPDDRSPCVAVARRVTVEPQMSWSEARAAVGDDRLAFSPWRPRPGAAGAVTTALARPSRGRPPAPASGGRSRRCAASRHCT